MNSLARYKCIDLAVLALIMCFLEGLISFGRGIFPGEVYVLSVVLPVSLIVIMRWGWLGLLHAAIGGAAYAALYGSGVRHLLIYTLGNLGIAVCVPLLLKIGKEKVRGSAPLTVLYVSTGWFGMVSGRAMAAFARDGGALLDITRRFYGAEALSFIAAIIILLIARRQNGVFEDQRRYLLRLEGEKRNDGR